MLAPCTILALRYFAIRYENIKHIPAGLAFEFLNVETIPDQGLIDLEIHRRIHEVMCNNSPVLQGDLLHIMIGFEEPLTYGDFGVWARTRYIFEILPDPRLEATAGKFITTAHECIRNRKPLNLRHS